MRYHITGQDLADFLGPHAGSSAGIDQNQFSYEVKGKSKINFRVEQLPNDIGIIHSLYHNAQQLSIAGSGEQDLLEIQINLSPQDIHYRDDKKQEKSTLGYTANIVFLAAENNSMDLFLPKDSRLETFDIHIPLSLLERYAGQSPVLDQFIGSIKYGRSGRLSPSPIALSPDIIHIIHQMQHCNFEGFTRKIYLESKVYELIAVLHHRIHAVDHNVHLSKDDQEKIRAAASYIREHLDHPLTVLELARLVGTNQTKLKQGFKEIFGNTIFSYLQDLRMSHAQTHLLDTDLSVQEIASLVGYNNSPNFSVAFKRYYGCSPQDLRK